MTLYYERRYYDAGLYRAAPVPFTISPQTVYEVQHFGKPLGTFTVWNASRSSEGVWAGTGTFRTAPDPAMLPKAKKPAAAVVVEDPTRPKLHRREGSEGDHPVAKKDSAPPEDTDSERPKLHRRDGSGGSSTEQPASRTAQAATAEPPQEAASDRPILRRGKPAEEPSGGDLRPGTLEAGMPGTPLASPAETPKEKNPEAVQRQIAVSDAGRSEPQELLFSWAEPQRLQMEKAAREIARSELLRLAPMRGLSTPGASAKAAASPSETNFKDEQFVPYDLDYKDYAIVVYSARYRLPASGGPPGGAVAVRPSTPTEGALGTPERSWVVTVIARQDGDKLVKLYSAVSDPRELDLYPEVRLVDAVDPEGYGRFALLFREQKRDGVSWLLGRVAGYELQTIIETAAR